MELILILVGIIWFASKTAEKKRRQQQKEEEARRQALGQTDAPAPAGPLPTRLPPVPDPVRQLFDPYFGDVSVPDAPSVEGHSQAQPVMGHTMQQSVSKPAYTAMDIKIHSSNEDRHTLQPSSISGHAHVESSITGFEEDCPPAVRPARQTSNKKAATPPAFSKGAQRSTLAGAGTVFSWNADEVTQGIILAEILGKPKALQRRA